MSAVWTFSPARPGHFQGGETLPIELTLQAFRTYKGDIVTGVRGEIYLRNENTKAETERRPFIVKEFAIDRQEFPSSLPGSVGGEPKNQHLGGYLRLGRMAGSRPLYRSWPIFWHVNRRPLFAGR